MTKKVNLPRVAAVVVFFVAVVSMTTATTVVMATASTAARAPAFASLPPRTTTTTTTTTAARRRGSAAALCAEKEGGGSSRGLGDDRRAFLSTAIFGIVTSVGVGGGAPVANASGGATAGKYTTIPIAKRRYYGRVQQAVHEFLDMGPEVIKGDMTSPIIQTFFDTNAVVIVEAKRRDVNGQCTKKDGDCRGKEIRDSRYNDMKTSMYLLGNAFRLNQVKAPDNLPTVRAAKAFFKEMDAMEKAVTSKRPKTNDPIAVGHYAAALDILDQYLDLVELPPTDSGHYDQEFDTLVGETSRIT